MKMAVKLTELINQRQNADSVDDRTILNWYMISNNAKDNNNNHCKYCSKTVKLHTFDEWIMNMQDNVSLNLIPISFGMIDFHKSNRNNEGRIKESVQTLWFPEIVESLACNWINPKHLDMKIFHKSVVSVFNSTWNLFCNNENDFCHFSTPWFTSISPFSISTCVQSGLWFS